MNKSVFVANIQVVAPTVIQLSTSESAATPVTVFNAQIRLSLSLVVVDLE